MSWYIRFRAVGEWRLSSLCWRGNAANHGTLTPLHGLLKLICHSVVCAADKTTCGGVLCRERCLFDTGRLNSISLLESITCPSMSAAGISGRARFVSSKGIPHEHIIISRSRLISSIFHSLQKP
ncbi:hypothetical protein CCHR01_17791 [Colletotrichum chrysophilum]|uniref:Uncharacterized protein n=1 Tax=Colletotrichum chrysophilum TaxID=1836956 RepID=A0AAD9E6K0_9PEZI|nr:hypothetical protein CCHR01_17791 [Colletotrichum chrysophilum]